MSVESWSNRIIACLVCGIFIIAGICLPGMPVAVRVLWVVMPSIFIIFIAAPLVRSLTRKPQSTHVETSKSPVTPGKRYIVTYPPDREYYEIKTDQGIVILRVYRGEGDPDETPVGAIKQALGSMILDNLPVELTQSIYMFELTKSKFVFEAADGKIQGVIKRRMIGMKYMVYDAQGNLMAVIEPTELVEGLKYCIDDPQGHILAESDDVASSSSYRILSPTGGVIAHVSRSGSDNTNFNDINIFDMSFDPFLIYCYVVTLDNAQYWQKVMSGWNRSYHMG